MSVLGGGKKSKKSKKIFIYFLEKNGSKDPPGTKKKIDAGGLKAPRIFSNEGISHQNGTPHSI